MVTELYEWIGARRTAGGSPPLSSFQLGVTGPRRGQSAGSAPSRPSAWSTPSPTRYRSSGSLVEPTNVSGLQSDISDAHQGQ